MSNPLLSVIIVNYNGEKFLKECFNSLYNNLANIQHEIIIVDNQSTDQSVIYIKENYPEIILIESEDNLGFGLGNNLGVKHAKGKYVLLFNNDTILLDPIDTAIEYLENHADVGTLGIKMLDANKNYLPAAGIFPNPLNLILFKKLFFSTPEFRTGNFKDNTYEVDWISGSFMLMKKELYESIGGFDKDYFMYVEDVDICKKIANKNLKRVFFPSLKYIHFVGFNTKKNPLIIKGYKTYINKHHKNIIENSILNLSLKISAIIKKWKYD